MLSVSTHPDARTSTTLCTVLSSKTAIYKSECTSLTSATMSGPTQRSISKPETDAPLCIWLIGELTCCPNSWLKTCVRCDRMSIDWPFQWFGKLTETPTLSTRDTPRQSSARDAPSHTCKHKSWKTQTTKATSQNQSETWTWSQRNWKRRETSKAHWL